MHFEKCIHSCNLTNIPIKIHFQKFPSCSFPVLFNTSLPLEFHIIGIIYSMYSFVPGFFFTIKCFYSYFIYLFIYLFLAVLGLRFVRGLSPVAASGGHASSRCGNRSSSRCAGPSLSRPLPLRGTGSRRAGSATVAHGPSRSAACGILPDQGSNPCPPH